MNTCERCAADNSDDASFCGNCGAAIAQAGSVASLVDDTGDPTRPGAGPGAVSGLQTSEWVPAPSYGETGPASVPGPAPVAPPTTGDLPAAAAAATASYAPTQTTPVVGDGSVPPPPPGFPTPGPHGPSGPAAVPVASGNSARRTNLMVAALAVAVVVIVGGIVLLLSRGGDGDEFARTGGDPPEASIADDENDDQRDGDGADDESAADLSTTVPDSDSLAPEGSVPPDDAVVVTTVDPAADGVVDTTPVEPAVTAPPPPTAPPPTAPPPTAPPPTAPPPTAPPPTAPPPPPPTIPPRAPGDLGLAQPILDWPCTGDYITFVRGIVGGDRPYGEQVEDGLRDFPDSGYLWGGICPSIRTVNDAGNPIYGIIYGPFATAAEACLAAQNFSSVGAYVRQFTEFESDIGRDVCG